MGAHLLESLKAQKLNPMSFHIYTTEILGFFLSVFSVWVCRE